MCDEKRTYHIFYEKRKTFPNRSKDREGFVYFSNKANANIIESETYDFCERLKMEKVLKNNGEFVKIYQHKIHIYRQGNENGPKIVLMSGSGTVAPVYDFKILYEKLLPDFRIIVIEKFGYGYSDICDFTSDVDTLVYIQKQALEKLGVNARKNLHLY